MQQKNKIIYMLVIMFIMLLSLTSITYATKIKGGGTSARDPYKLNFDLVANGGNAGESQGMQTRSITIKNAFSDKKRAFWFTVTAKETEDVNGIYIVEYNEEANTVRIDFVKKTKPELYYKKEHANSEEYEQRGFTPIVEATTTTSNLPTEKFRIVEEEHNGLGGLSKTVVLKNTYLPSSVGGVQNKYVTHPGCYVFIKEKGGFTYKLELTEPPEEEKAGVIEFAITKILLGIGDVFMAVSRAFLGKTLTMDAVIFNRYDMTTIDFTGKVGVFAQKEVQKIVNGFFNGFVWLAVVINVIILLYIGIQVLLNVGGEKQSKYMKNLQNWIMGVALLFLIPRFFPFLTTITNAVVGYIGSYVSPYVTQYSVVAILGEDALLGEDASTVEFKNKIKDGISIRTEEAEKLEEEIKKQEKEIEDNFFANISNIEELVEGVANILKKVQLFAERIAGRISDEEYAAEIAKINSNTYSASISNFLNFMKQNYRGWNDQTESQFEKEKTEFCSKLPDRIKNACGTYGGNSNCAKLADGTETHDSDCEIGKLRAICDSTKEEYLKLAIKESEITSLTNYLNQKDLMGEMRVRAGKTGRVVYALIWFILFFQLISLLALYYRRIFMIAILIILFPVVMVTYAIDKVGDGKAQTLETWIKEFTVNVLVQIAHAVVYVTLIKTGMEFYEADSNNWLFFILAILCLFPMERLLRGMFGLTGSTIGTLKSNVAGGLVAGAVATRMAYKGAKGVTKRSYKTW